ncbi:MAG: hypothetical protein HY680_07790 [Chloroflexi bacterium]|nr:hypothetical protein [Chloroflexota bacterium]
MVEAVAVGPCGEVYAGGVFIRAGATEVSNIAMWDGRRWWPLGSGVDRWVFAIAVGASGEVYVGGAFTRAGDVKARHIAKWDGTRWSALGEGIEWNVTTLLVRPEGLYAGGMRTPDDQGRNGVARWDGERWTVLEDHRDGSVDALAFRGTSLFIGGRHWPSAHGLRIWDGVRTADPDFGNAFGDVFALAVMGANLYVGGSFQGAGLWEPKTEEERVSSPGIVRWNGQRWLAMGDGTARAAGRGYEFGVVRAIAIKGNGIYIGGDFDRAGDASARNIARWDGRRWWPLGPGIGFDPRSEYAKVGAMAVGRAGEVYAAGEFLYAGSVLANSIARWDGRQWSALVDPQGDSDQSLTAASSVLDLGPVAVTHPQANVAAVAVWNGDRQTPLNIERLEITGKGAADFRVVDSSPSVVPSCTAREVAVEFAPKEAGPKEALLTITTSDPAKREIKVALQGRGLGGIVFDEYFFEKEEEDGQEDKRRRAMLDFLVKRLQKATGLRLEIQERQLVEVGEEEGQGSGFFRRYLRWLMQQRTEDILVQNGSTKEGIGDPETGVLTIDFEYWYTAPELYDIAVIFAHEAWHIKAYFLQDAIGVFSVLGNSFAEKGVLGLSVRNMEPMEVENIIRQELGMNLRASYSSPNGFVYVQDGQYRLYELQKGEQMTVTDWGLLEDLGRAERHGNMTMAVLSGYVGGSPPPAASDRVKIYRTILLELRLVYTNPATGEFTGPFQGGRLVVEIDPFLGVGWVRYVAK